MSGRLQQEIKQRRPFSGPGEEALLNILRTADALTRQGSEVLRPLGLTVTQFNVLRILRGAGEAGLACGEIADRMVTRDPDVTRLLDRLEKRKLIARERQVTDRRVVRSRITAAGEGVLAQADVFVAEANRRYVRNLSATRLATLVELLEAVRDNLG